MDYNFKTHQFEWVVLANYAHERGDFDNTHHYIKKILDSMPMGERDSIVFALFQQWRLIRLNFGECCLIRLLDSYVRFKYTGIESGGLDDPEAGIVTGFTGVFAEEGQPETLKLIIEMLEDSNGMDIDDNTKGFIVRAYIMANMKGEPFSEHWRNLTNAENSAFLQLIKTIENHSIRVHATALRLHWCDSKCVSYGDALRSMDADKPCAYCLSRGADCHGNVCCECPGTTEHLILKTFTIESRSDRKEHIKLLFKRYGNCVGCLMGGASREYHETGEFEHLIRLLDIVNDMCLATESDTYTAFSNSYICYYDIRDAIKKSPKGFIKDNLGSSTVGMIVKYLSGYYLPPKDKREIAQFVLDNTGVGAYEHNNIREDAKDILKGKEGGFGDHREATLEDRMVQMRRAMFAELCKSESFNFRNFKPLCDECESKND